MIHFSRTPGSREKNAKLPWSMDDERSLQSRVNSHHAVLATVDGQPDKPAVRCTDDCSSSDDDHGGKQSRNKINARCDLFS